MFYWTLFLAWFGLWTPEGALAQKNAGRVAVNADDFSPLGWPLNWREEVATGACGVEEALGTPNVYLLGGQSNMQGLGKITELPGEIPRVIPHAFFWNGEEFEPLVLGQTKSSGRISEFGPEIGFALEMATPDCPVYLIKYHASGMPLHHGWNGNDWVGGEPAAGRRNFYPGENPQDGKMGTLYAAMRAEFLSGIANLVESGHEPTVGGFVWMQGEQDSKHEISATAYAESLRRLRKRLAEDLRVTEDLPMVFGQVLPHSPAMPRFLFRDEIRRQMAACDGNSGRPEAMSNTRMVSTDDLTLLPDTVHYDTAGQLKLGAAFGKALKQLAPRDAK